MKFQILHNTAVGAAFIGTVLVIVEVLLTMDALPFNGPENLDILGYILVVTGSILASWTANKMDKKKEEY